MGLAKDEPARHLPRTAQFRVLISRIYPQRNEENLHGIALFVEKLERPTPKMTSGNGAFLGSFIPRARQWVWSCAVGRFRPSP
jgi:hypothetical protein